jgi:hypothetical protein
MSTLKFVSWTAFFSPLFRLLPFMELKRNFNQFSPKLPLVRKIDKVKVKFSLSTPWRRLWGADVYLHWVLTSALYEVVQDIIHWPYSDLRLSVWNIPDVTCIFNKMCFSTSDL